MKILGIDPGSQKLGFALVESTPLATYDYVASGVISLPAKQSFYDRLQIINTELAELLLKLAPDEVVMEKMFFAKNPAVALKLGEVRGMVYSLSFTNKIPVVEYSVKEVKKFITGYGNASKEQMQLMVQRILSLDEVLSEDASDAMGLALYRANFVKI